MDEKIITTLAVLFTGPNVANHSVRLSMGGLSRTMAQEFFAARDALGLQGYPSEAEAAERIRAALTT